MGLHTLHTNIALDYPTVWSGMMYSESNIREIFNSESFIDRILNHKILGAVGFRDNSFTLDLISHYVVDAYISDDREIMFDIITIDNQTGKSLDYLLSNNPMGYLAKIVAAINTEKSINGYNYIDKIICVNVDENVLSYKQ